MPPGLFLHSFSNLGNATWLASNDDRLWLEGVPMEVQREPADEFTIRPEAALEEYGKLPNYENWAATLKDFRQKGKGLEVAHKKDAIIKFINAIDKEQRAEYLNRMIHDKAVGYVAGHLVQGYPSAAFVARHDQMNALHCAAGCGVMWIFNTLVKAYSSTYPPITFYKTGVIDKNSRL